MSKRSKYSLGNFIAYDEQLGDYDVLTAPRLDGLRKLDPFTEIFVTGRYDQRPDLLAWDFFETTELWWLVLEFNALLSFEDLREGMRLRLPSKEDVEDYYFRTK